MAFGCILVGPPGSGKSTCCKGLQHFYELTGRPVAVINLDPANDQLPYECSVDIADLVSQEEVAAKLHLGPNGGLLYCMAYLAENLDWLQEQLQPLQQSNAFLIFDCPGQLELYTYDQAFKTIVDTLTNVWHCRLAAVSLMDAQLCTDAGKYMAALLASLSTMLHLELPHINLLSKADLIPTFGQLAFDLSYYLEVQDLTHLVGSMAHEGPRFSAKYQRLAQGLCEVVEDFSLLSFIPMAIEDKDSVQAVVAAIDKATGYVFKGLQAHHPYPELAYAASAVPAPDLATQQPPQGGQQTGAYHLPDTVGEHVNRQADPEAPSN